MLIAYHVAMACMAIEINITSHYLFAIMETSVMMKKIGRRRKKGIERKGERREREEEKKKNNNNT